jgi:cytosine/adenosine deaminase-related metal-dependent hydrolase
MLTAIRNGLVVDVERGSAARRDVLVDGPFIREVGAPGLAAPEGTRVIDATQRLVLPGLVNAHMHAHGALGRGAGDRWNLELLLNAAPAISGRRTLQDKYLSAALGAVEMVSKGCTACYDMAFEFPAPTPEGVAAVAQAYADVGIRAVVAPMIADRTFYEAMPVLLDALPPDLRARVDALRLAAPEETLAAVRAALTSWKAPRERVRPALGPTIPLHCSDDFMAACRDLAKELDVGVQMHLAESRVQASVGRARYGRSLTAHLAQIGLLGPRFTAAHAIWLDDDEIGRLADAGASVAHNPGSNLRLGSGIARVRRMRERGLNVGVGTDGASSADNLNMFEATRLASFVSRVVDDDPDRWISTREALAMATIGSARALGFDDIGRIAPGARADLVLLDARHVNYLPVNDAINQIVHAEDATAVRSVMVDGRLVVEEGRVTTVDVARLASQAEAAAERLRASRADARILADQLSPIIRQVCGSLAR